MSWHGKLEVIGSGGDWFVYIWRKNGVLDLNGPYRTKAKADDAMWHLIASSKGGYVKREQRK